MAVDRAETQDMHAPRGRPRVALSSASVYPLGCAAAFEAAAELGYDGIEIMVWNDPISQDLSALSKLSDQYRIPVLAIHAPTLLLTQTVWGGSPWSKITKSAQLACDLDAQTIVVHPPFRWQRDYAQQFIDGVNKVEEHYEVQVAVENMFPWRARQRELMAYAPSWDPVPQPYRNVTLDLSHTATAGSDAMQMLHDLGPRLAHLHLADGKGSMKDEHLVPGRGGQPCKEVLSTLAAQGWSGTVVAEVNTRRARSPQQRQADLAESLAFARRWMVPMVPASRPRPEDGTEEQNQPPAGGELPAESSRLRPC